MKSCVLSDSSVLAGGIERRAFLYREVPVSADAGFRVELPQVDEQIEQCCLLLECARVLHRLAVGRHATDVADTDGVCVVAVAVGTDDVHVASRLDMAVAVDDVVVADVAPAVAALRLGRGVPASDVRHGVVAAFRCGGAMDDDLVDVSFRAFQTRWDEHGESGGAYDAVNLQSVECLELLDCFLCVHSVDTVWQKVECLLYLLDHLRFG